MDLYASDPAPRINPDLKFIGAIHLVQSRSCGLVVTLSLLWNKMSSSHKAINYDPSRFGLQQAYYLQASV